MFDLARQDRSDVYMYTYVVEWTNRAYLVGVTVLIRNAEQSFLPFFANWTDLPHLLVQHAGAAAAATVS